MIAKLEFLPNDRTWRTQEKFSGNFLIIEETGEIVPVFYDDFEGFYSASVMIHAVSLDSVTIEVTSNTLPGLLFNLKLITLAGVN